MSVKGENTFEEIVERLVALFKPQLEDAAAEAGAHASSSETTERRQSASAITPSEDDSSN